MKKFYVLLVALLLSAVTIHAQESATTVTITEDEINNAIAERLAQSDRDLTINVNLQNDQVTVTSVVTSNDGALSFTFETILVDYIVEGRITWTATDWKATAPDGTELERDDIPRQAYTATDDLWQIVLNQLIRRNIGEARGVRVSSVSIVEDSITVALTPTDDAQAELPPNVTENEDGTFTVNINEAILNRVFANIASRSDAMNGLTVTLVPNGIDFSLDLPNACPASILVDFDILPPTTALVNSNLNRNFVLRDLNDDGFVDLGILTTDPATQSQMLNSVGSVQNALCENVSLPTAARRRVNGLLLPAVQRFMQVQGCGADIYDIRFEQGLLAITFDETYTTCGTTHL